MRPWLPWLVASSLAVASAAGSQLGRKQLASSDSSQSRRRQSGTYTDYTIDMPIDHFPDDDRYLPHTNATFKQRYVFDDTYYKPGGPVYLYIGGETSIENRLTNLETGIIQILMNATNGLGVIIENRYYGESWPYTNLTTDNLAYLTNEQTIADFAYFAQHAVFPGVGTANDSAASLTAPGTPWILYGGSLAGAQTAFAVKTYGESVLYGGIAASAVIQVAVEYPEWYAPVQKYAPQDCVAIVNNIVDRLDGLVAANNTAAVRELQAVFGLDSLTDLRDFAKTIAYPVGGPFDYPTETWQELSWQEQDTTFWAFCSAVTDVDAPANVTAVDAQMAKYTNGSAWTGLGTYAQWIKTVILPTCENGNFAGGECFGQGNATYWQDLVSPGTRSYIYTTCTEAGLYQAAPAAQDGPSLLSRVMTGAYTQEICTLAFPPGTYNRVPASPDIDRWNAYGGYDLQADRLAFIDGQHDPWLAGCYHGAEDGTKVRESSVDGLRPEYLLVNGGHHWDSYGQLDIPSEPQFVREAHYWEIRTVKRWLKHFEDWVSGAATSKK